MLAFSLPSRENPAGPFSIRGCRFTNRMRSHFKRNKDSQSYELFGYFVHIVAVPVEDAENETYHIYVYKAEDTNCEWLLSEFRVEFLPDSPDVILSLVTDPLEEFDWPWFRIDGYRNLFQVAADHETQAQLLMILNYWMMF